MQTYIELLLWGELLLRDPRVQGLLARLRTSSVFPTFGERVAG
jgi:hypothetical protein